MKPNQILEKDFLDILFDNRNKDYGAYSLRRNYNTRLLKALGGTAILIGIVFSVKALATKYTYPEAIIPLKYTDVNIAKIKKPEKEVQPSTKMKSKVIDKAPTVHYTTPKVIKDNLVVTDPPDINDLTKARIDIKTQEGKGDVDIIAPPNSEIGTKVIAAPPSSKKSDEDSRFIPIEKEAQFPGGPEAWSKYVSSAINREISEFGPEDYGTCVVKFIVDQTGRVSGVQAATMKETKLAEVAVNAIR